MTHGKVYNLFANGHLTPREAADLVTRRQPSHGHFTTLLLGVGIGWALCLLVYL